MAWAVAWMLIARQVGFDHYLVKPTDPAQVLKLLEERPAPARLPE